MFKIPLVVIQIDERRRTGEHHILQLALGEANDDTRINIGDITLSLKIRPEGETDPEAGFDRKRFETGDIWYLVKQERPKEGDKESEPPTVNE